MSTPVSLAALLESFFTQRLMAAPGESSYHQFLSRHLPSVSEVHRTAIT